MLGLQTTSSQLTTLLKSFGLVVPVVKRKTRTTTFSRTKGYHIEHNFGHGKHHLASFLLTLNLLAFLFHTVLHLGDQPYQQIRLHLGTRKRFFNDLRTLTTYFVFESWQHLISFMLNEFDPIQTANSS
jgi:hypothetical protein